MDKEKRREAIKGIVHLLHLCAFTYGEGAELLEGLAAMLRHARFLDSDKKQISMSFDYFTKGDREILNTKI